MLYHHRTLSRDGMDVHIEELVAALRRRGHDVCVVGPQRNGAVAFGSDGGLVNRLRHSLPRVISEALEISHNLASYLRLRRACAAFKPDILYERYNLYLLAGTWLARRHRLPYLLEVNAPLYLERSQHGGLGLRRLARWAEGVVWRGADKVLPVSGPLADCMRQTGVADTAIEVIPNGVDRRRFPVDTARPSRLPAGRITLGFVGFIRPWHGLEQVVELLAQEAHNHDLRLLAVGDGPARVGIERLAEQLGVADRVEILGVVGRDDVTQHIAGFDIALQPNVMPYASPLKLFEYMALGRAIVAPDTPNIREILEHEKTALLFAPGDVDAFRQCVSRLCADQALRRRLGEAASAAIEARSFLWDRNAERIEKMAVEFIGRGHQS